MKPLLLYSLQTISNHSFESSHAANTDPPGWSISGSVNGDQESQASNLHSAGDGIPSLRALRQNVVNGTAGNKALCRQRLAVPAIPAWMRTGAADPLNEGLEWALAVMFFGASEAARRNAYARFKQFDGGTVTIGSGTEVAPARARAFECGIGTGWTLQVYAANLRTEADWVDLELGFDLVRGGSYDAGANAFWDRCFFGALADLERGFRRFDVTADPGFEINRGNGRVEVVKTEQASSEIEIEVRDLIEGSPDERAWTRLWRHLAGNDPGYLAVWQDRGLHTNAERHFQRCTVNPKATVKYPTGLTRKDHQLRLIAPAEWGG